jgi:hypothetical protein
MVDKPDREPRSPPDAGSSITGWLGNFTGCLVAPGVVFLVLAALMLMSALGVPVTEREFASAASLLPVGLPLVVILVEVIAWSVRRWRRASRRPTAITRGIALFLTAAGVYAAVLVALPVAREGVDVTDKNSLTFQVFWPQSPWDLAYLYDCGGTSTDLSVSVGTVDVAASSNAGFIVVQRLSPGPTLVTVHAGGCN